MIAAILLAAAAAVPQPAALKIFGDWVVGCDNGRACQAVALFPEAGFEGASLALKRGPEAGAVPDIWITTGPGGAQEVAAKVMLVDGHRFDLAIDPDRGAVPRDPAGVATRLGQATRIALLDGKGAELAQVSVKGSAAALLYMDEQQRRVDTATALVRRGFRPASSVPSPPPLPRINEVRPGGSGPAWRRLSRMRADRLRAAGGCDPDLDLAGYPPEMRPLDRRTMLVLIRCWQAAYNSSSLVLVGRKSDGSDLAPAKFDYNASVAEQPNVYAAPDGADWDEEKDRLISRFKGRGLGDCGSGQEWAWDGARFRLVREDMMSECRGSTDYITTWRAQVR